MNKKRGRRLERGGESSEYRTSSSDDKGARSLEEENQVIINIATLQEKFMNGKDFPLFLI